MAYPQSNPETSGGLSIIQMRVFTLGEAVVNLDTAFSIKSVPLPNLPGVDFLRKDLEG